MANKEKEDAGTSKVLESKENELSGDTIKTQLQEKVDYHNKLIAEKEKLSEQLAQVNNALNQNAGGINTLQGLQNEYFVEDKPSVNGEA